MSNTLKARVFPADYGSRLRLYLFNERGEKRSFVENMTLIDVTDGAEPPSAAFIDMRDAQQFMDDLWSAGVRPTDGKDPKGQIAATQRHLEDMRAIAFAKLKVAAPK